MMLERYKYVRICSISQSILYLFHVQSFRCNNEKYFFQEFTYPKDLFSFSPKMTTRSQKRNAVAEIVPGELESSVAENNSSENPVAGPSNTPRVEPENLEEIKTSLRREIMSDLTEILAENQKEMLELIAPLDKKQPVCLNVQDSESDPENITVARTSTLLKTYTAISSKTTPSNSRNMVTEVLNDSTNQPTKRPKQQRIPSEQQKDRPPTSKILFASNRRHSHLPIYFQCRKN